MTELGTKAPAFRLRTANPQADGLEGDYRSIDDYKDARALVVVFTCNHCPYARHVERTLIELAREFQPRGVAFVAICSNDAESYPEDSFENMAKRAKEMHYPFPYLHDESQEVARAYGAVCTPDLFVYNADRVLVYRGRVDETRPGMGESDGKDLRHALEELLETGKVSTEQYPSMGCNIKWKESQQVA